MWAFRPPRRARCGWREAAVRCAGADLVRVQPEDRSLGPTYVSVGSIGEAAVFRSG